MRVVANGIGIEVDDAGPPDGEPLLLVMGLAMQLVAWPDELLDALRRRGFRPIRFDNRDIGLSQWFDALGVPSVAWAALRYGLRLPVRAPYSLADMAADTVGVLDALGLPRVHLCGASMGGMIAQHVAAAHPGRVKSLTLMMTTSGARGLPPPAPAVRRALLQRPRADDPAGALALMQQLLTLIASPAYPPQPQALRQRIAASIERAYHPAGATRQLLAVIADGDRSPLLRRIAAPTLVLHGRDDPLVRVAAAHDLVSKIAQAEIDVIPGWGHDLPPALMPRLADAIARHAARAAG
ncbi:alpha/beta fold hydrolase [Azohydromonas sediminis]|uniref:alpha/beta fold hydrolase n=1 Tax=Azohydromonas sediminis TaxID=2259674 RepID=UPI000E6529BE|nr:alpha/beta hydrolase [Azohydromonas sediminis]